MKNLIKLFSIVFLFGAIFMSCEGPEGPAGTNGIDGIDGEDGTNGTATCFVCHDGESIETIKAQFYTSQHALGDIAVDYAGGRGSCAECHSHQGFVEWALTGDVAEDFSAPEAWKCSTCHTLHTEFDETDWAFRADDAITLSDGSTFDDGASNLCANCHQARRESDYYDSATAAYTEDEEFTDDDYADMAAAAAAMEIAWGPAGEVKYDNGVDTIIITFDVPTTHVYISSTHAGPHHGPQANMFAGASAAGGITGSAFTAHAAGCTGCHMGSDANHSFMPQEETCTACHTSGVPEDDMDAVYDRLVALAVELEAVHAIHIDSEWEDGDPLFGYVHPVLASIPRAQFEAFWNFMYMVEDRSLSVHNPTFYSDMLDAAEAAFAK